MAAPSAFVLASYVGPYYAVPWLVARLESRRRSDTATSSSCASPPISTTLADRDAPLTIAFRAACGAASALAAWAALAWVVQERLKDAGGPTGLAARLALARAAAASATPTRLAAWAAAHAPALLAASPLAAALVRAAAAAAGAPPPAAAALGAAAAASGAARLELVGLAGWTPTRAAAALAGLGASPAGVAKAAAVGGGLTALALAGGIVARATATAADAATKREPGTHALLPPPSRSLWTAARDLAIAPLAEEAAFRGGLLPLLLLSGWGPVAAALLSAAAFGAAHTHHAAAAWLGGRATGAAAARVAAAHAASTAAFGLVAAVLALRMGCLAGPLAAHIVANAIAPDEEGLASANRQRALPPLAAAAVAGAPALAVVALVSPLTAPARFGNGVPGVAGGNALLEVAAVLGRSRRG